MKNGTWIEAREEEYVRWGEGDIGTTTHEVVRKIRC